MVNIEVRRANSSDNEYLFNLRNDPQVIQWSVSGRGVSEFEHSQWFSKVMGAQDQILLIGEGRLQVSGRPMRLGMVRFDAVRGQSHQVSIAVTPGFRGAGLGQSLLNGAISYFECHVGHVRLNLLAQIHHENEQSLRLFRSTGFEETSRVGEFITLCRD